MSLLLMDNHSEYTMTHQNSTLILSLQHIGSVIRTLLIQLFGQLQASSDQIPIGILKFPDSSSTTTTTTTTLSFLDCETGRPGFRYERVILKIPSQHLTRVRCALSLIHTTTTHYNNMSEDQTGLSGNVRISRLDVESCSPILLNLLL